MLWQAEVNKERRIPVLWSLALECSSLLKLNRAGLTSVRLHGQNEFSWDWLRTYTHPGQGIAIGQRLQCLEVVINECWILASRYRYGRDQTSNFWCRAFGLRYCAPGVKAVLPTRNICVDVGSPFCCAAWITISVAQSQHLLLQISGNTFCCRFL